MKKIFLLGLLWMSKSYAQPETSPFFEQHTDVGAVHLPGNLQYRPQQQEYEISASGSNIWLDKDEFHYAWRKLKGDFILQARVRFLGEGKDPHHKVGWMIRDELSTASVMTAVTVHGDGLTALQFRKAPGKNVEEIRSPVSAPDMIQLERKGKLLLMSVARFGDPYQRVSVTQVPSADEV
ncbi:MAG: biopolymer transporter TolR, partial [Chitinophagaceae bacterium]